MIKRAVRTAIVHALYALGLLQIGVRVALRRRAVVLMYHRVLNDQERARSWSHPAIIVSRRTFERQMQVLSRRLRVLSAAQFQASLEAGRFEPNSCLVTFDDGWIDTYTEAWPVLRRYSVPALVFLPSAFIGTGDVFWQERLGSLLGSVAERARKDQAFAADARRALTPFKLDAVLDIPDGGHGREAIMNLVRRNKSDQNWNPDAAVRAVSRLVTYAPEGAEIDRFIDWNQATEMMRDGVTFGAHGESHRLLTTLTPEDVAHEVHTSQSSLERQLGRRPSMFCYPNGDWNGSIARVVGERFALAFSTRRGHVDPKRENRLAIRRINVHEDMTGTEPLLLARILGII